jgi:hypothetical protein
VASPPTRRGPGIAGRSRRRSGRCGRGAGAVVDGRGGQDLGHKLIKGILVQIRADRDGAFLISGIDQAIEAFGGVLGDGQQPDVIDHGQVCPQDPADGFADGLIGTVAAEQDTEIL